MSILLNGPRNYSAVTDVTERLFDVCPALDILYRDPSKDEIVRLQDRGLNTGMEPSPAQCLEKLSTVVNFDYFSSPGDFNSTIYSYLDLTASLIAHLRKNRGIWVNLVPDPENRITDSALDAAMSELVSRQSDEEAKNYRTGDYVSYINVRLINGCTWFSAEQTCLLVDYLSKYRDILVNMPGKELRLF